MLLKSENQTTQSTPALKASTPTYPNTGAVDRVHTEKVVVASVQSRALRAPFWLFHREEMMQEKYNILLMEEILHHFQRPTLETSRS